MRMSPFSRNGRRSAMVVSTAAAGTISHTARGGSSFFTKSASEEAPTAFSWVSSCTAFRDLSKTTHWWPPLRSRRTMLAPMRPSPISPSCITDSFEAPIARPLRFRPLCGSRRSRVGRLEDAVNGCVKHRVELSIGLRGRQPLDQGPGKARHDAVIPPQALVAFLSCISARQRNHSHDLGMLDEFRVQVVLVRQGQLEHYQLPHWPCVKLLATRRPEQRLRLALVGALYVYVGLGDRHEVAGDDLPG